METATNAGDIDARDSKNKLLLAAIVGVVAGALLGVGTMFYFFRGSIFLNVPEVGNATILSYPQDQKAPTLSQGTNIVLPKKLVSKDYYLLINKIINELGEVGANNNNTVLPLMNTIKQRSAEQNFNGILDIIVQAKGEIKTNIDLLGATNADIAALQKENNASTSDTDLRSQTVSFLASADTFVRAFSDYYSTLNETLSGSVPTQSLLNTLADKITALQDSGSSLQSELNSLLKLIDQKNKASMP